MVTRMTHDISELGLGIRAYNCLRRTGINTVEEVAELSNDDLLSIRHMGVKAIDDVRNRLKIFMGTPTYDDLKSENEKLRRLLLCVMNCNSDHGDCELCPIKGGNGIFDVEDYCDEILALFDELEVESWISEKQEDE